MQNKSAPDLPSTDAHQTKHYIERRANYSTKKGRTQ